MSAVDPRDRPDDHDTTALLDDRAMWVALVRGEDRPGTLTALTSVFSDRGVSFESLSTGAVDGAVGTIAVTFTTTARRQALLLRTVARLAVVSAVQVRRADDPAVLAAAIVQLPTGVSLDIRDLDVRITSVGGPSGAGQRFFLEGSLAEVSHVVEHAREAGAIGTATVILGM